MISGCTTNEFDRELFLAFADANIPLNKLENVKFKRWLEKYMKRQVKTKSFFRKYVVDTVYDVELKRVYEKLSKKDMYLQFDETTDCQGKYLLNILGGLCFGEEEKDPFC